MLRGFTRRQRRRQRSPVRRFLARRLATGVLTLVVVSLLIFFATNALPGNVAQVVLGKNATPQRLAVLSRQLGLNKPLLARYLSWFTGMLHGNLGQSAVALAENNAQTRVSTLIGGPLLNSAVLATVTASLLLPLSLLIGTAAAYREGRVVDHTVSSAFLVLGSLPEFVLGTFLILVFFSQLHLLPPVDPFALGTSPLANLPALVLPVLTLLGTALAFSARQVRAGVIGTLRQDYVRMARLNGLREPRVLLRYALRNALAPSVQSFAQSMQYLLGGIFIVEALFAYPGIGTLVVQAVQARDVTEVEGVALLLAAIYILINIFADLIVVLIVPKLRTSLQ